MDQTELLSTLKAKLGYSTTVRDTFLNKIIEAVQYEMADVAGIREESPTLFMLIVDIAAWRHDNPQNQGGLPINLQRRMNDLMLIAHIRT